MTRATLAAALLAVATPILAKVPPGEAEQLRNRLTPVGAERVGNAAGTIPTWNGGLVAPPPCHGAGARLCDPYADDRPLATITARNLDQWRDWLSAGQIDALLRHADTLRFTVYPSRRSAAHPGAVYEAAWRNAAAASLGATGHDVVGAVGPIPFPIPKNGVEPIWNHKLRYRGPGYSRVLTQAVVTPQGEAMVTRFREEAAFPYAGEAIEEDTPVRRLVQVLLEPTAEIGTLMLIIDGPDPVTRPADAWIQVPEPRRMRRAQSFGYDNPGLLAGDLRFDDQIDAFSGNTDRYPWRIVGKRDLVVPYNAYALHAARTTLRELIRPGHLDPAPARYELHRVWVIEASVRPGTTHRYKRRTFYVDEDSWQILLVDLYDAGDRLWRWQETHTVMAYDRGHLAPTIEAVYDLQSGRYLVQGPDRGDPEIVDKSFTEDDFSHSAVRARVPR
ncbi:MAG TPA: DUF1329 domain-containing protein [Nevskiaceae bacterium]|nr:DUF1329 domain-containing protein [Nevskiaceae bacterium]